MTVGLTTDRGKIKGDTDPARLFILLHELAHNTEVIKPDATSQTIVDDNDKDIEKNCAQTLKAIGKK